jgi:PAS domain S-box-containing protein
MGNMVIPGHQMMDFTQDMISVPYAVHMTFSVVSRSAMVLLIWNCLSTRQDWLQVSLAIKRETFAFRLHAGGLALLPQSFIWKLHPYLLIAAILVCLAQAALIAALLSRSRRSRLAQASIMRQLALERVLSTISTTLADCPTENIDSELEKGLNLILEAEAADRVCWYAIPKGGSFVEKISSVHRPGVVPGPARFEAEDVPWIAERLSRLEPVAISDTNEFPSEADRDHQFVDQLGVKSVAFVPSSTGAATKGLLILVHLSHKRDWPDSVISKLGVLGNLFGSALLRKWAQNARQASEQRFQAIFEQASLGIALEDLDGRILFANSALCTMMGYGQEEIRRLSCDQFSRAEDSIEDLNLFQKLRDGTIDSYQIEKRYVKSNGAEIWGNLHVSKLQVLPGEGSHVIAMVEDITERKAANTRLKNVQLELQRLTARLIQAQEEERQRISGELHDDFGQRLSLLIFGLERLKSNLPAAAPDRLELSRLQDQVREITDGIHELSHEIHSSKLQYLGLKPALTELCQKMSEQRSIEVNLELNEYVPLHPDVQLCLYRIVQEALNNVVKHSGSDLVTVSLIRDKFLARLQIRDNGVGFDTASTSAGLGLASMRERLRIVQGALSVDSVRGHGTEITAEVPLSENAVAIDAS